jgi:hypothetical protein
MDQDYVVTNTPRSNARRNERDSCTLDSPERRRTPQVPRLPPPVQPFQLPAFPAPLIGPFQFADPFQDNYAPLPAIIQPQNNHPAPAYQHIPVHPPPLQPLAPPVYQHLPPDLAQRLAALPPLLPVRGRGRGRGRGHGHNQLPVWNANQNPAIHPAV